MERILRYNPTPSRERHPLAPPSNRVPPKATATYERYFTRMKGRILGLAPKEVNANLSRREQQTLSKLEKRKDIVINKADKGSCIVIEDTHTYIENGREHLANDKIYEPLDTDYTKTLTKRINETVKKLLLGHNNEELPKIRRGQGKNTKNVLSQENTQNTNGHQTNSLRLSQGQRKGSPEWWT